MDFTSKLEAVIEEIRRAKPVPFSASAMINKKEILERLESVLESAPEDLKKARSVMRERDEILDRIKMRSKELLTQGKEEQDRLVGQTEIVSEANHEAERIVEKAKARARQIRMQADEYVDAKLANFEMVLQKTLASVSRGRESLRPRPDPQGRRGHGKPVQGEKTASAPGATLGAALVSGRRSAS